MSRMLPTSALDRRRMLASLGCCAILPACRAEEQSDSAPSMVTAAGASQVPVALAAASGTVPEYAWPAYFTSGATYNYGFRLLKQPGLTVRPDRGGVTRRTTKGYVCFSEGGGRNPDLTDAMVSLELDRLNADLKIAIETMGFAPDKGFSRGDYLNYYLLGSGLADDDFTSSTEGGYQGSQYYNGEWWPCTCTSYHAIRKAYDGDTLQRSNITHETIHVLQSGTGSFSNAGWFHEAHNTQFGSRLIDLRDGTKQLGFLDAVSALGPHIPIEAFAGWMKDGTFGGPSPDYEHADPRDFFGGAQYCGTFPLFLHLFVGQGVTNWLWKYNRPNTETVLQTLERGLGTEQTQRAILEYRARVALVDFGAWRNALREQVDPQFPYYPTMYAATTRSGSTLLPATETLPGTSGANYIPLTVSGSKAQITFSPSSSNMRCLLAYRATDGTAVYGAPASSGACSISLSKPALNGTVVAVVANVDTTHSKTRKFPYTVSLGSGLAPASLSTRYF